MNGQRWRPAGPAPTPWGPAGWAGPAGQPWQLPPVYTAPNVGAPQLAPTPVRVGRRYGGLPLAVWLALAVPAFGLILLLFCVLVALSPILAPVFGGLAVAVFVIRPRGRWFARRRGIRR